MFILLFMLFTKYLGYFFSFFICVLVLTPVFLIVIMKQNSVVAVVIMKKIDIDMVRIRRFFESKIIIS